MDDSRAPVPSAAANSGGKAARPRKVKPLTEERLRNIALFYLQRHAANRARLRRVLMRRVERDARLHGSDAENGARMVERLIARFAEVGVIDDPAFARARAAALHRRGQPLRAVRAALTADGAGSQDITDALRALQGAGEAADLRAAALYARRRRLGPFRPAAGRDEHFQKDLAALARRGFDRETAQRVLNAADGDALRSLLDIDGQTDG